MLTNNSFFYGIEQKLRPYLESMILRFNKPNSLFSPANISGRRIVKKVNKLKADVVHLHWINNGMLSIEDLKEINAPIVWTFHDSWPYTGGCHIVGDCKDLGSHVGLVQY